MLLETFPQECFSNKCINYVVKMEKAFNIGNYNQVLQHSSTPPIQEMGVFLQKINDTIRYAMARSAEVSYEYLKVADAIKLFSLRDQSQLEEFVRVQEVPGKDGGYIWSLENSRLCFNSTQT